jgi:hypothetical protein
LTGAFGIGAGLVVWGGKSRLKECGDGFLREPLDPSDDDMELSCLVSLTSFVCGSDVATLATGAELAGSCGKNDKSGDFFTLCSVVDSLTCSIKNDYTDRCIELVIRDIILQF